MAPSGPKRDEDNERRRLSMICMEILHVIFCVLLVTSEVVWVLGSTLGAVLGSVSDLFGRGRGRSAMEKGRGKTEGQGDRG